MVSSIIKEISKQEISCVVARMILKYAELNNIPSNQLLRGTGAYPPYLFEPANWTGENVIIKMLENLTTLTTNENGAEFCGGDVRILSDEEIIDIILLASCEPTAFYRNFPGWFSMHFRIYELSILNEHENSIMFQLQRKHGKNINIHILKWIIGLLKNVPSAFNMPPAKIEINPAESTQSKVYKISVSWEKYSMPAIQKEYDTGRIERSIRRLIKRFHKLESKREDFDRVSFLLKESESRFKIFFDAVMDSVLVIDEGGYIIQVNRRALEMLQKTREQLIGMPAAKLVEIGEEEMISGLLQIARKGKTIPIFDIDFIRGDGMRVPVQINASAIEWPESGGVPKILLIAKDITSLKRSQDEARRMRDINEIIVNGMLEGIFMEDANGMCRFANPRMEEMLGYNLGELKGTHWTNIVPDEFIKPIEEEMVKRRMGLKGFYQTKLKRKDGTNIPVKISALPLFEEGVFAGVLSVVIDLSDIRKILPSET